MSVEPNINEIASKVAQAQISNIIAFFSAGARTAIVRVLDAINKDLKRYTEAKYKKCSYVRTPIINRDHSTRLRDLYVKTRFKSRREIISDNALIGKLSGKDSIIIYGDAGSGKSMFMKLLFLELCSEKSKKIPLFLELRELNATNERDFQKLLYQSLLGSNAVITQAQFADSLRAGVYSLILDGFDEIDSDHRKNIETQISQVREQCSDLQIIISSRPNPDRRLETWAAFETVYIQPMQPAQATELISKLDYDTGVKEKFLEEAKASYSRRMGRF